MVSPSFAGHYTIAVKNAVHRTHTEYETIPRLGARTAGGGREGETGAGNQGEDPLEALFTLVCQRSASARMHGRAAKLTQQKGAVAPWRQAGCF